MSGVARQWEFAFTEPGYKIRLDRVMTCPSCEDAHQRVFLETEWDEEESDYPDRSIVLTLFRNDQASLILVDHYELGERQVQTTFQVEDLQEFFLHAANDVAEAIRALRRVSLHKSAEVPANEHTVCLN